MTGLSFLFDPIAFGVVLGGTLIATLLRGPRADTARALAALGRLVRPGFDAAAVRAQLAQAERVARDRGVLAIDRLALADPDIAAAIAAIAAGATPDQVAALAEARQAARADRHRIAIGWWLAAAEAAPAMGMIGTLFGLVALFRRMDDPAAIGPAMAVALLATLYGALVANLVAAPLAARLARLSEAEAAGRAALIAPLRAFAARELPSTRRGAAA